MASNNNNNIDAWNVKHIITTFIVGLFIVAIFAAGIGGCVYDRTKGRIQDNARRTAVEQCLKDGTRSAVDCRIAVYGRYNY